MVLKKCKKIFSPPISYGIKNKNSIELVVEGRCYNLYRILLITNIYSKVYGECDLRFLYEKSFTGALVSIERSTKMFYWKSA